LLRFPAVFTAVADVMMGFLVTHGELHLWPSFLVLTTISASLYLAGMVLNDVFDADIDALERPNRPIPSRRITRKSAVAFGAGLIVFALLLAETAVPDRTSVVAFVLAGCVMFYDTLAKHTVAGPLVMGCCRSLNVLLGMSFASLPNSETLRPWTSTELAIAVGVGAYIAAVTWFARNEAESRSRQTAVRYALRAIIVVDAAIVLAFCGLLWACAVLALLVPMLLLERWASTT
jgi:4-hydroxybenzoate polyprenyltransferase